MEIRNAGKEDFDEIYALWKKAGLTISDAKREHVEYDSILSQNPQYCLVAEDNGRILGSILGSFNGRTAWIYHLAVDPTERHKGVGSQLMKESERRMRADGVTRVRLGVRKHKQELVPFYQKFGFSVSKDIIYMGKKLT